MGGFGLNSKFSSGPPAQNQYLHTYRVPLELGVRRGGGGGGTVGARFFSGLPPVATPVKIGRPLVSTAPPHLLSLPEQYDWHGVDRCVWSQLSYTPLPNGIPYKKMNMGVFHLGRFLHSRGVFHSGGKQFVVGVECTMPQNG